MEELKVIEFLLSRVDNKIYELKEYQNKLSKVLKIVEKDEANGQKGTYWKRKMEFNLNDPSCKTEIRETLKLIRKLSFDVEKKISN